SRPRIPRNFDGDRFARSVAVKRSFTVADVEARACEAFRLALSQGVCTMRAQADVDTIVGLVCVQGLLRARERFRGLLDVQVVAFRQEGLFGDPGAAELLAEAMASGADLVGGLPNYEATEDQQIRHLDSVFDLAERHGVGVDIHIDYDAVPEHRMLEPLAERAIVRGFGGRVLASHCCALETYESDAARRVIDKVREAEIDISIVPQNFRRAGRYRGVSRAKELLEAGVNV